MTRPSPSWRLSHKSSHWPARTRHATLGRHLGGKFVLSLPHRYLCGGRNVKTRATVQTLCDRPGRRGRPPRVRPTPPQVVYGLWRSCPTGGTWSSWVAVSHHGPLPSLSPPSYGGTAGQTVWAALVHFPHFHLSFVARGF